MTGRFPTHRPLSSANNQQLLANTSSGIAGWNGPYLEAELDVGIAQTSTSYGVWADRTDSTDHFDLDGDGVKETSSATLLWLQMTEADAQKLSNIIDRDGDITSGNGAWFSSGRVKRQGNNDELTGRYIVYLGK